MDVISRYDVLAILTLSPRLCVIHVQYVIEHSETLSEDSIQLLKILEQNLAKNKKKYGQKQEGKSVCT